MFTIHLNVHSPRCHVCRAQTVRTLSLNIVLVHVGPPRRHVHVNPTTVYIPVAVAHNPWALESEARNPTPEPYTATTVHDASNPRP